MESTEDINLRHLFSLPDIADSGRLSVAAERVFLSQSALTQALRKLEDKAGSQLFERVGFGVTATESGRVLVRRAQRAISLLSTAERELKTRYKTQLSGATLQRNVTSSQLRALINIVETGGYSLAARKLGLAQPSLHRAAKELEGLIGIKLFPRAARGIKPTETARDLARVAALVFAEIRQGFERVRELRGMSNSRIAVGCLPLARSDFVPGVVTQLLEDFPDARVSILDGPYLEQLDALRYGQIDWLVGALRQPPPTNEVIELPLFEQSLAVAVQPRHPMLAGQEPIASELAQLDWIVPRPLAPSRMLLTDYFQSRNIVMPAHVIECGSLVATLGLLQRSHRAAVLSPMQARPYVESGQLALLVESLPGTNRSIGVTVRENWEPTIVQSRFTDLMKNKAAGLAQENSDGVDQ